MSGTIAGGVASCWCPKCGKRIDSATGVGHNKRPRPGDLSVCLYCGAYLQFDQLLAVELATDDVLAEADAETREWLRRAREAIQARTQRP